MAEPLVIKMPLARMGFVVMHFSRRVTQEEFDMVTQILQLAKPGLLEVEQEAKQGEAT